MQHYLMLRFVNSSVNKSHNDEVVPLKAKWSDNYSRFEPMFFLKCQQKEENIMLGTMERCLAPESGRQGCR